MLMMYVLQALEPRDTEKQGRHSRSAIARTSVDFPEP